MEVIVLDDQKSRELRRIRTTRLESVRVRLSFQKFLLTRYVWEKSKDAYSLSIRVQTTINHISICFLSQYQRQRKCFFRARAVKRHCIARHIDASSMVIFDWFVLNMRMQVILDFLFARPGSAPVWGGKKEEFRYWTT